MRNYEQSKQMKSGILTPRLIAGTLALILSAAWAVADGDFPKRTLYVATTGDDNNDGRSSAAAFRTISAAAERTEPGDLVVVRGGTYHESVTVNRAGTAERPIVFRAARGETVVVTRADKPEQWELLKGSRSTWSTNAENAPSRVYDQRSMRLYVTVLDTGMVDARPGTYFFDPDAKRLYVNLINRKDPGVARVVLVRPWLGRAAGFLVTGSHNQIQGFTITFQPDGIHVRDDAEHVRVIYNTIYGCSTGVLVRESTHFIMSGNHVFLNDKFGLQLRTGVVDALIESNTIYANGARGPAGGYGHDVETYITPQSVRFRDNLVMAGMGAYLGDDRLLHDKRVRQRFIIEGNVFVDGIVEPAMNYPRTVRHNTVVRSELRDRNTHDPITSADSTEENPVSGNLVLDDDADVAEAGFASPLNNDYRLHAGSPHLGEGAFPEAGNVRYVSIGGDDEADGRTPSRAWRTLSRAVDELETGRTIYVMSGLYCENLLVASRAKADEPAKLKTYGDGEVVIDGAGNDAPGLIVENSSHLIIEGFIFRNFKDQALIARTSDHITLSKNVFAHGAIGLVVENSDTVSVLNNTFNDLKMAVEATATLGRLVLRNNLFIASSPKPITLDDRSRAILISECNAFAGPEATMQLAGWGRRITEPHASVAYDSLKLDPLTCLLPINHQLAHTGLGWKPIGARGAPVEKCKIEIERFRVAAAAKNQAVIQWTTPTTYPEATLKWWRLPDGEEQTLKVAQSPRLKETQRVVMIAGLEPDTTYRVRLDVSGEAGAGQAELDFSTLAENPSPTTRYVSIEGSDENDGSSWDLAMRTLSAASAEANAGDTILVGPGIYREPLQIWQNGLSEDQHLTFRSVKPGMAIIDLVELFPNAISGMGSHRHITIDGFRIRGLQYGTGTSLAAVRFSNSEDLSFVNNVFEAHSGLRSRSPGSMTSPTMHFYSCNRVLIENNIFHFSARAINFRSGIYTLSANATKNSPDSRWKITNNIIVRGGKHTQAAFKFNSPTRNLTMSYNLHWPEPAHKHGQPLMYFRSGFNSDREMPRASSVEQLQEIYGVGEGTLIADPMIMDPDAGDFRLHPDSPARGGAKDGTDIGARNPPHKTP
ncbi:MAG: right-handed parallel beta-helix repeat-containing protein [Lentisphaerae bacterium]|nr:right-handed parallel beta-helix repeat-containing protein [Lentisphaerota bacterium]